MLDARVSAPASGWPPTNRSSSMRRHDRRASSSRRRSRRTRSSAARAPRATVSGSSPTGTRDEHHLGAGDRLGDRVGACAVDRAALDRGVERRAPRPVPVTVAPSRSRGGEPDRAPDQPDTDHRDPHCRRSRSRRRRAARRARTAVSEPFEDFDGLLPPEAAVGDRLAVAERRTGPSGSWRPPTRNDSIITPTIAPLPGGDLSGHVGGDRRLALGVLAAVVVAEVDHHALGQAGRAQQRERRGDRLARRSSGRPCRRGG